MPPSSLLSPMGVPGARYGMSTPKTPPIIPPAGIPTDRKPAARVALLIQFDYGNPPQTIRYAAWSDDVILDGNTFTAIPGIELTLSTLDGGTKDAPATLVMPNIAPLNNMKTTHPDVSVTIWEMEPSDETSAYILHAGIIANNEYNHNGNANTVQVQVSSRKKALGASLSITIGRFCPWIFGSKPCLFDREARKEVVTIVSIDRNRVTASGLVTTSDPTVWKFGGIRFNSLEVSIHSQVSGTQVIYTTKPLPPSWVGETVDVLPGCDYTVPSCTRWAQLTVFGGMGIKIPDRDVRYQS